MRRTLGQTVALMLTAFAFGFFWRGGPTGGVAHEVAAPSRTPASPRARDIQAPKVAPAKGPEITKSLMDYELGELARAFEAKSGLVQKEKIETRFRRLNWDDESEMEHWAKKGADWEQEMKARSLYWIGEGQIAGSQGPRKVLAMMTTDWDVHRKESTGHAVARQCFLVEVNFEGDSPVFPTTHSLCSFFNESVRAEEAWMVGSDTLSRGLEDKGLPLHYAIEVPRGAGAYALDSLPRSDGDWVEGQMTWRPVSREFYRDLKREKMRRNGVDPDQGPVHLSSKTRHYLCRPNGD